MKGLLIFAAGLAVGAVTGALVIKNKVLAEAKAEVEEVREYYKDKVDELKKEIEDQKEETKEVEEVKENEVSEETEETKEETFSKKEYVDYSNLASRYSAETGKKEDYYPEPYIIDPEEYGAPETYDTMCLTYFADGVLIDDVDDVIDDEDVDIIVGKENLKVFENPDVKYIYVRSELYQTDYEISRDDWKYSELSDMYPPEKEKKPHQL